MNHCKNTYNFSLLIFWTSCTLQRTNFVISAGILWTLLMYLIMSPGFFLYALYWFLLTPWRWSRSKHVGFMTNCVLKKCNFNIGAFLGFVVRILFVNGRTWVTLILLTEWLVLVILDVCLSILRKDGQFAPKHVVKILHVFIIRTP